MPSAWMPIRLISLLSNQRASYSRKPVAFTIGSDSKAEVLGTSTDLGFGNIRRPRHETQQKMLSAGLTEAQQQRKADRRFMMNSEGIGGCALRTQRSRRPSRRGERKA